MSGNSFKIVVLGGRNVGKTQLINRYARNEFNLEYKQTTIVETEHKKLSRELPGIDNGFLCISLEILDVPGCFNEDLRGMPLLLKNSSTIILCYDTTNVATFNNLPKYLQLVRQTVNQDIPIYLVGTKYDLVGQRQVEQEHAQAYAERERLHWFETSAKSGTDITELFDDITETLAPLAPLQKSSASSSLSTASTKPKTVEDVKAEIDGEIERLRAKTWLNLFSSSGEAKVTALKRLKNALKDSDTAKTKISFWSTANAPVINTHRFWQSSGEQTATAKFVEKIAGYQFS